MNIHPPVDAAFLRVGVLPLLLAASTLANTAHAEASQDDTTIAQWDFNFELGVVDADGQSEIDGFSPPSLLGEGEAVLIGGVEPRFSGGDEALGFNDGWQGDPAGGAGDENNYGWQTTNYPEQGTGDGTAGAQFHVSTEGLSNITVSYAHRFSGRSSRHAALEYSVDGGDTWQLAYEYEAVNGHNLWYFQRFDFTHIPEANDNPDFAFRVVAIFMPGSDVPGYEDANNNRPGVLFDDEGYQPSGTWRFDSVGVYADHPPVRINEFMGRNHVFLADEDGDYESWLELHNHGAVPVNLANYGLSDDEENPFRWIMPSVTLEPGEFLLIFCSNKDRDTGELHTNFSISADGEELLLTHPDGRRIDEIPPYELDTNISLGRTPDGAPQLAYFAEATPGASNSTPGYQFGPIEKPTFSVEGGLYPEAFELTIESDDPEAVIYYTLDGSEPGPGSEIYRAPILIQNLAGTPNVLSEIPTNFMQSPPFGWNPPLGEVYKANVVRARAFKPDHLPGRTTTHTYWVDEEIFERYEMPLISIATDQENFFDEEIGIYVPGIYYEDGDAMTGNYFQRGIEWERPIHFEFYEADGTPGLAQDLGVRIHGGNSRRLPQKTLRLYARNAYSDRVMEYPFFIDHPVTTHRRLILRQSGQDWGRTNFRDAMMQELLDNQGVDTQASRTAIVFVNGEYWGIHNIRERYDRHYLEQSHDVDPDQVDLLTGNANVKEGSNQHYNALKSYVSSNDLALDEHYQYVKTQMDVDNFVTYYVAQIYYRNHDWPGGNEDYWRPQTEGGRWQWLLFDTDLGYNYVQGPGTNSLTRLIDVIQDWRTVIFRNLLDNDQFRYKFCNRMAEMLNTAFSTPHATGVIDAWAEKFDPLIEEQIHRWRRPASYDTWYNGGRGVVSLLDFAEARPGFVRQHVVDQFDLGGTAELTFVNETPEYGTVTINSLELAQLGSPWTGVYFQDVPLPLTAEPAEGYVFLGWEVLEETHGEATFFFTPDGDASIIAKFAPESLLGDLNGDGVVNVFDLLTLLDQWGVCEGTGGACPADLNGDGVVDVFDLLILLDQWG